MAEQVELLASAGAQGLANSMTSAGTPGHANSTTASHASLHRAENLIGFDARYGRKPDADADADVTSCRDSARSCCDSMRSRLRGVTCKSLQVLNFVERHVPVVTLIRTYKVGRHRVFSLLAIMYTYFSDSVGVGGCRIGPLSFPGLMV